MTEQQRAEYMAIVAALASQSTFYEHEDCNIASYAMGLWKCANEVANKEKP